MGFKKVEREQFACTTSDQRPFGCMELWAGNERAHRSLELAGLESDVIAVPSGGDEGGDLSAVFSCTDNIARVVLADCVVKELPIPLVLADFSEALLGRLQEYRGRDTELEDDVTLLTLRRKIGVLA